MKTKLCPTCKSVKSVAEFYIFRGEPHGHCKLCHRLASRKYSLKKVYGLSLQDYTELVDKQNRLCAICKNPGVVNSRQKNTLFVDHSHKTGKVRGLLCIKCNTFVGYIEKNPGLAEIVQQYITNME